MEINKEHRPLENAVDKEKRHEQTMVRNDFEDWYDHYTEKLETYMAKKKSARDYAKWGW